MKTKTSDKEYLKPDASRSIESNDLWADVKGLIPEAVIEEARKETARLSFARALTTMRVKAGISQRMMAAALDCTQPRICAIESTPNERISMTAILRYCEVTSLPFKSELENGRVISVSRPRKVSKQTPSNASSSVIPV